MISTQATRPTAARRTCETACHARSALRPEPNPSGSRRTPGSFDHLVGAQQKSRRDREPAHQRRQYERSGRANGSAVIGERPDPRKDSRIPSASSNTTLLRVPAKSAESSTIGYRRGIGVTADTEDSFDHLIRAKQDLGRDSEVKSPGSLEVDDEFVGRRLLHWHVGRLGSLQDLRY
jgi:hypothetical protein